MKGQTSGKSCKSSRPLRDGWKGAKALGSATRCEPARMGDLFPSPGWVPWRRAECWCKSGAARLAGVNAGTNWGWITQISSGWRSRGCTSPSLPSYFFFGNPGLQRESLSGLILRHMTPGGRVKEKGNNFLQLLKEFSCI